jgi:hypothetical protein
MKFYLWLKQNDNGCDYTIGCGQRLILLKAETIEQARAEVPGTLDYYGVGSSERQMDHALILSLTEDAMPMVRAREEKVAATKANEERERKRSQLERLKRELGE